MDEKWLSVEDIAKYLGVKRDTIYKWISNKSMPAHKVSRKWLFDKPEVDEWVRGNGSKQASNVFSEGE